MIEMLISYITSFIKESNGRLLLSSFYYTSPSGILDILLSIGTMGMGGRRKNSIFVEVMVRCVSWYINEEVVIGPMVTFGDQWLHACILCAGHHVRI